MSFKSVNSHSSEVMDKLNGDGVRPRWLMPRPRDFHAARSLPSPLRCVPACPSPHLSRHQLPQVLSVTRHQEHIWEKCCCALVQFLTFTALSLFLSISNIPPSPMHFLGKESELESRDTLPAPLLGGDCEPSLPFAHSSPETSILDLPSVWGSEPGSALCPLQLAAGPSHLSAVT